MRLCNKMCIDHCVLSRYDSLDYTINDSLVVIYTSVYIQFMAQSTGSETCAINDSLLVNQLINVYRVEMNLTVINLFIHSSVRSYVCLFT